MGCFSSSLQPAVASKPSLHQSVNSRQLLTFDDFDAVMAVKHQQTGFSHHAFLYRLHYIHLYFAEVAATTFATQECNADTMRKYFATFFLVLTFFYQLTELNFSVSIPVSVLIVSSVSVSVN
jgi:hypothetical protein